MVFAETLSGFRRMRASTVASNSKRSATRSSMEKQLRAMPALACSVVRIRTWYISCATTRAIARPYRKSRCAPASFDSTGASTRDSAAQFTALKGSTWPSVTFVVARLLPFTAAEFPAAYPAGRAQIPFNSTTARNGELLSSPHYTRYPAVNMSAARSRFI